MNRISRAAHRPRRAMTLTELLVVVGIIVILLALTIPAASIWQSHKVEDAINLDMRRREILVEVEALKAERNAGSRRIGELMRTERREEAELLKARMSEIGDVISALDDELKQVEADLAASMLTIPNLPLPEVPIGKDDSENVVIRTEGEFRTFEFEPRRITIEHHCG